MSRFPSTQQCSGLRQAHETQSRVFPVGWPCPTVVAAFVHVLSTSPRARFTFTLTGCSPVTCYCDRSPYSYNIQRADLTVNVQLSSYSWKSLHKNERTT